MLIKRANSRRAKSRRAKSRRAGGGERGFTLLEVIVAFTIVALALSAVFQIFSSGLRSAVVTETYNIATLLAESKLTGMGIEEPLAVGDRSGSFENGYRWLTSVRPYDNGGETSALEAISAFEVTVTVTWGGSMRERTVSLSTLRLAAR